MDKPSKPTPDRHLITSPLPCVDGVGHLGGLAGPALPADAYARFLRARGERVLFVCATAEHCRRRHLAQVRLAEEFGLSFDAFGRTSSHLSREQTRYLAKRLDEEGFLEARSMGQGRHLFLLQSKLAAELRAWLDEKEDWPRSARATALERLDEGLGDRSITQGFSPGVPVDRAGFEDKVYSSWFDAPIAYIGATREWAEDRGEPGAWRRWWRRSEEVRYVQFINRGEVPLHTVGFPCTLLGSGEEWKLADFIKVFDQLTCCGEKSSTGEGGGISVDHALELVPADCWRYYLLANAPEAGDTSFSWAGLAAAVNEDLAGGFAGFVDKSLSFADQHFRGEVPRVSEPGSAEAALLHELDPRLTAYTERMEALEFRGALAELRAIWRCGNAYLDRKKPWVAAEREPDDAARAASFCVHLVRLFSRLAEPVVPFTAERVLEALDGPGGIGGSIDHETGLGVLEAQAPSGDGREYQREEEQHRHR
jgi:methionyl-tRNA synthetase